MSETTPASAENSRADQAAALAAQAVASIRTTHSEYWLREAGLV